MNKIRYNKKLKVSTPKIGSAYSTPPHQLIATAQDRLKEFHLSKSQICGERQLSPLLPPQLTLRKTIQNAINRQTKMSVSLHDLVPGRPGKQGCNRRASLQSSRFRESELMRRVSAKTEDSYPQISAKQFCLKRIRKLFRNHKMLNEESTDIPDLSLKEYCQKSSCALFEPWEVREDLASFF